MSKYPKPAGVKYGYGTAGFRLKAELLPSVVYRVGILAALRSKKLGGKAIGVMITASHNPVADNGVKIVDPLGEMLESQWESIATELANLEQDSEIPTFIESTMKKQGIPLDSSIPAVVVIARDTRPSGELLAKAAMDGANYIPNTKVLDQGLLTTPQCHYIVRSLNTKPAYGVPTEQGYYEKFSKAYVDLLETVPNVETRISPLVFDAANGVGAEKMKQLATKIGSKYLKITIINAGDGTLNLNCGSDHVKVTQGPPLNVKPDNSLRFASVDGDADRLVYFYFDKSNTFHLLDGDKIAALSALFLGKLAKSVGISLDIGIVQTAYANGNSTKFLAKTLGLPVACVETGVKHLHHKAEEFDIGIYFEANGHGTILFGPGSLTKISGIKAESLATEDAKLSLRRLKASIELINQSVGDALSVMLFVECVLLIESMSPENWDAIYTDLANRQLKAKVKDRSIFRTIKADTELISPEGFQALINNHVSKFNSGRCFVRPSGTEDVVRVYAEAETQKEADDLGASVLEDLKRFS